MRIMADNKLLRNYSEGRATPPIRGSPMSLHRAKGAVQFFFF
jgi:hypothetical protein